MYYHPNYNCMNILMLNCNSITNKIGEIKDILNKHEPDIFALCETWLHNYEPKFSNYTTEWKHRGGHGGGIGLLINKNVQYRVLPLQLYVNGVLECQAITVYNRKGKTTNILNLYNPNKDLTVGEFKHYIKQLGSSFLILGDFNAHTSLLVSETVRANATGITLEDAILEEEVCLINEIDLPTYIDRRTGNKSCLDLCLSSPNLATLTNIRPFLDVGSDHMCLKVTVEVEPFKSREVHLPKWKTDATSLSNFSNHYISPTIMNPNNVNSTVEDLVARISNSADICLTKQSKPAAAKSKKTPWWSKECAVAVKDRRLAHRKFWKHPTVYNKINYKAKSAKVKNVVKLAKQSSLQSYVSSLSSEVSQAKVWAKIKAFKSAYSPQTFPITENNTLILDDKRKADILCKHYQEKASHSLQNIFVNELEAKINHNNNSYNSTIARCEFNYCLNSLKNTAPGPDRITNSMIKSLHPSYKDELFSIYSQSLATGDVPKLFKIGHVIPIIKPNKPKEDCASYRPITLLSCLGKFLEKIIQRRLEHFVETNNILQTNQCGFRPGKETCDILLQLKDNIYDAIQQKKYLACMYVDLEGAFDVVWWHGLLYKLANIGIDGNLLLWFKNYLTDRKIKVTLRGQLSDEKEIKAGVPQGAVLSPILFNIMLHDLPTQEDIQVYVFADDITIACSDTDPKIVQRKLQGYTDQLIHWTTKWGLKISSTKTKIQHFTRKRASPPVLVLDGAPVKYAKQQKLLGIIFDSLCLTWNPHINYLHSDCLRRISIMKIISSFKWGASTDILKMFYIAYVRSKILYGSPAFSQLSERNLNKISVIQNSCLRLMLGARKTTPILSLEAESQLPPLRLLLPYKAALKYIKIMCRPEEEVTTNSILNNYRQDQHTSFAYTSKAYLKELGLPKVKILPSPVITTTEPWSNFQDIIYTEYPCNEYNNFEFQEYLHLNFPEHTDLYTDGSKNDSPSTAAGIYIPSKKISVSWLMNPNHTVIAAELFAIRKALQYIDRNIPGNCIVFSDSLSALQLIGEKLKVYKEIVEEIKILLIKLNTRNNVVLHWVKSHVGIQGNEAADKAANLGHKNDRSCLYQLHAEEILCIVKKYFTEHWDNYWKNSCLKTGKGLHHYNIRDSVSTPTPVVSKTRLGSVALYRYRLGHVGVGEHMARFNMADSPLCEACNVLESIEHVLLNCIQYNQQRETLMKDIKMIVGKDKVITLKTILGGGNTLTEKNVQILNMVEKYLCTTKLIGKI